MIDIDNKIEFPYNNSIYFKKAINHLENNEVEKATYIFQNLYKENSNFAVNYFYTFSLYELGKYDESFKIMSEYRDEYLKTEYLTTEYAKVLIKAHQFVEAEFLIHKNNQSVSTTYKKRWQELTRNLFIEREKVNTKIQKKKENIKEKIMQINNFSLVEQAQMIEDAYILNLDELQPIASYIFSNPLISGQVHRSFLELLIEKNDTTEYRFPWFNQEVKICPNKLDLFHMNYIVKNIDELLEEKLYKNPSLVEVIKNEIINDLLLLYPLIEETITDTDYWIDQYIALFSHSEQLDLDEELATKEQKKMRTWFEKLNIIAQRNYV